MNKLKVRLHSLLRWSEKYFKTDMIYLARGGFWLGLSHAVQIIIGAVLLFAFANLIPKDVFGTYQYIISMASVVGAFTLTGMGIVVAREAAHDSKSILRFGFRTQIKWGLITVLTSFAIAAYYYTRGNILLSEAFLIIGTLQPFISGFSLYKPYLLGRALFSVSTVTDIGQKILPFVSIIVSLFLTKNPIILATVYFSSHTVSYFILYLYVTNKYAPEYKPHPEAVSFSKHLSLMTAFEQLASNADKALIWIFMGATPVAVYTLAQTPITHLFSLFGLVRQLVFPKLAKKDLGFLKENLSERIRKYFYASTVIVLIYIVTAPFIFKIFFPAYASSVIFSQVLALGILSVPRNLITETFYAHKLKKELYILNISTPAIRILLLAILLPIFGIWGAVASILLTEWYTATVQWVLFSRIKA